MSKEKTDRIISRLKDKEKIKILFVCLGNICRSPAAEGVMRSVVEEAAADARFHLDSAGTQGYHEGQLPDSRMRQHAFQRGLHLDHICRRVRPSDFDDFDLIIGMDDSNLRNLKAMAPTPEAEDKIIGMASLLTPPMSRWDHVPDPYYEGAEGFELVLDLLDNGCRNLYELLK